MNIELDEIVAQDVSDDALELAAGEGRGGLLRSVQMYGVSACFPTKPAHLVTSHLRVAF